MADPVVPGTSQAQNSYESQLLRNQFGTNGQLGLMVFRCICRSRVWLMAL